MDVVITHNVLSGGRTFGGGGDGGWLLPQQQPQPLGVDLSLVVRLRHHSRGEGHVAQRAALVLVHIALVAAALQDKPNSATTA